MHLVHQFYISNEIVGDCPWLILYIHRDLALHMLNQCTGYENGLAMLGSLVMCIVTFNTVSKNKFVVFGDYDANINITL